MQFMRHITLLFTLVVLLGLLPACGGQDATAVTDPPPTATATAVPPTPQPTAPIAPTFTPTSTPAPTVTAAPTATPTSTPIPSNPVSSIRLEPVISGGLDRPLGLVHAGDERLFVMEQSGIVRILQNGELLPEPFLDIRDRVGSLQLEQGLLGLAFHPKFAENGRFFVDYTDRNGDTHISRFEVSATDPNRADPGSELILLTVDQPYANHNGGQLQFGPEGYLYIALGDGGSANDPLDAGQNPAMLLGSILRIDVDSNPDGYAIPPDNPFVGDEARRGEIWAWGLRNPWRFSFDRLTNDLFIADVGQNLYEELNVEPVGSPGGFNYGWNIMEATHCFAQDPCSEEGLVLPVFEYDHSKGCSITGGYMYRSEEYLELYGNYFLGDFCSGIIWRLFPEADGTWSAAEVLDSELVISTFGEDVNGALYVADHQGGSVWKLVPGE